MPRLAYPALPTEPRALRAAGRRAIGTQVAALCVVAACCTAWKPYTTTQGALIRWPAVAMGAPVTYSVDAAGLPADGLSAELLADHAAAAFAIWQAAACPGLAGCAPRPLGLRFASVGLRPAQTAGLICSEAGTSACQRDAGNQLSFVQPGQDWPHGVLVAALTLLTARTSSGDLIDADIVVNSVDFSFCEATCDAKQVPVALMLRHEVGHFVGLAHSDVRGALMASAARQALRSDGRLQADDIAGVCALYPAKVDPRGAAASCRPTGEPIAGCSATPLPVAGRSWLLSLVAGVAVLGLRRRQDLWKATH